MVRMPKNNEQLCLLAQKGDRKASELLLENNEGFIYQEAIKLAASCNLDDSDLCIDLDDLLQEGRIGLLSAISKYDADHGAQFLTYAAPAIRNAMTDLIRSEYSRFELRMVSDEDGISYKRLNLNEIMTEDEREERLNAIGDPTAQSPEQIYIKKESVQELYHGLDQLTLRQQAYLYYRYGFTDDIEHPLIGTAIHFHLSESRAKKLETAALEDLQEKLSPKKSRSQKRIVSKKRNL